ncbi:MAG TPA: hypothetical protein PKY59_26385 [Pyrinomonadaceae bacterium]|nr:hypothetical protein [Pyrinomonadaceae bacterium]
MLPPLPSWDGLHPIIVHFPIALLLVAPILVLIGSFVPNKTRSFLMAAFIVMLIGTISTWIAVSTGEEAGELAERMANVEAVLENHEELAETTSKVFTALTAIFGVIVFAPMLFKKELPNFALSVLNIAFLVFYGAGGVLLINTAHEGGRLVHEFGVRAVMNSTAQNNASPIQLKKGDDDDDD